MVTTNFLVPKLRYDTLDITGAATTPGSYAFLETAGDAASAIGNFGYWALGTVELRIDPTDCERSIARSLLRHGAGRRHV